jgi:hypothetical protein
MIAIAVVFGVAIVIAAVIFAVVVWSTSGMD